MKVICTGDPNIDYQEWIFDATGLELEKIYITVGEVYEAVGQELTGRCWGMTQGYFYLSGFSDIGKIPSKYFKHSYEIRKEKLDGLLDI